MTSKNDIDRVLWSACDSFRGKIDSSRYKDYILSMLFVKYLSDVSAEKRTQYMEQYSGDERRVERAMSRERFTMDEQSTFDYLYERRNDAEIGQKINVALSHIEEHNSGKLRNVFRAIDFNSQVDFGDVKEKNTTLRNLLEDFQRSGSSTQPAWVRRHHRRCLRVYDRQFCFRRRKERRRVLYPKSGLGAGGLFGKAERK